jgi:long-chain fatty acid transport protein
MQIAPTIACQLTGRLSIGFSPTVTMANIGATSLILAPPDDANGDMFATYPAGEGTRYHWGAGFQIGLFYQGDNCWNFGASLKSRQWMEDIRFHSQNELGAPRRIALDIDYPLIVSLGTAYYGWERFVFACDVRYFDYANTPGFEDSGFGPDGAARGLGWRSIWSVAAGAQYELTDRLPLRIGYSFGQNPIPEENAFFNIASALITEHIVYCGASYRMAENWKLDLAYFHAFENSLTGPYQSPFGAIPGTSVTSTVSADGILAGASVRY